jgi:hypothetical protein
MERTFCGGAQFCYRIFLNLHFGLETTSFQSGFKSGKQEKHLLVLSPENMVDGARRICHSGL